MVQLGSLPATDAQSERRLTLERKLAKDIQEVELLEQSLTRTNNVSERMEDMLASFDVRLAKLEKSILPIHKSTSKLTKLYDNINTSLQGIQKIISHFDLASQEYGVISKGPLEYDVVPYIKSIQKLKGGLDILSQTKVKSVERAVTALRELAQQGITNLDNLFQKWVAAVSTILDHTNPGISEEHLQKLHTLSSELAAISQAELGLVTQYVKIFSDIRSSYLQKSMQPLATASNTPDKKLTVYQKGSGAYITYFRCLLKVMKAERDAVTRLFPKAQAPKIFQTVITPMVDTFIDSGESMMARLKRCIQKSEFQDIFLLLDLVETMTLLRKEYDGLLAYAGSKGSEIAELLICAKTVVVVFFEEFKETIKGDPSKQPALSPDGTVHELTSRMLNILKRLLEHSSTIDSLLEEALSKSFVDYAVEIFEALAQSLETRSKGYKQKGGALAAIFLLNNYHYIAKNLKNSKLSEVVGPDVEAKFEKLVSLKKDAYRDSWKACIECLMDNIVIQGGQIQKNLSKSQRETIKEKFKGFNTELEEAYKTQKFYAVPDLELRAQLIKDIKAVILPFYGRFLEKYEHSEFSKNPDKYIKYDKFQLEQLIDKFFDASA
ncbi:Cullin repeat-like-containing domain protein [Polychytrium aggregatum]|uniref:Cullin repeat-like-containing domain protein n=1 Tax=Polychytrium aggregatum TaxID=110093 RepID=UPI0022FEC609|nr:Cullin repeat-like-containing domain protein [Polychytrium aggregatum]KAI9197159.1 Cullin repeat-like-containing domain protein [Polychytrium aggregatum]